MAHVFCLLYSAYIDANNGKFLCDGMSVIESNKEHVLIGGPLSSGVCFDIALDVLAKNWNEGHC